jgi:hypothetical protein
MLRDVEKLNPDFYPQPVELRSAEAGRARFVNRADGYLTRSDFKRLYDVAGDVLHMRNPFSQREPVTKIDYTFLQYAMRIQRLVSRHTIRLVDGKTWWIVTVPQSGDVQMFMAARYGNAKTE